MGLTMGNDVNRPVLSEDYLPRIRVTRRNVSGDTEAARIASGLAMKGVLFLCMPLPDDVYEFSVREDMAPVLCEVIETRPQDYGDDGLQRIRAATNRFEAADLIRAHACAIAARLPSDHQLADVVRQYERYALSLRRDFTLGEHGETCPESEHPWREWLVRWGFIEEAADGR